MRVIVIGATGTIGGGVADALEEAGHEVLRASRQGDRRVDLSDPASVLPCSRRLTMLMDNADERRHCARDAW